MERSKYSPSARSSAVIGCRSPVVSCVFVFCLWLAMLSREPSYVEAQQAGLPSGQCVPFQLPTQFSDYKQLCDYLRTVSEADVQARYNSVLTSPTPATQGGKPPAGCLAGCPVSSGTANEVADFFLTGWSGKCFTDFQDGLPTTARNIISPGASSRDSWAGGLDGTLMYEGVITTGPSWTGSGDSLLLDYPEELQEPGGIIDFSEFRDEMREVAPGMLIGQIWSKPGTSSNFLGVPTAGAWFVLFQVCSSSGTYPATPAERILTQPPPVPVGGASPPFGDLSSMFSGMEIPTFPEGFGPMALPDFLGAFGGGAEAADGEPFSGRYSYLYAENRPDETYYSRGDQYTRREDNFPEFGYQDYYFDDGSYASQAYRGTEYRRSEGTYYRARGDGFSYGGDGAVLPDRYFDGPGDYGFYPPEGSYRPAGDVYDGVGFPYTGGSGGGFPDFGGTDGFPGGDFAGFGVPEGLDFGDLPDFGGGSPGGGFPASGDFGAVPGGFVFGDLPDFGGGDPGGGFPGAGDFGGFGAGPGGFDFGGGFPGGG